MFCTFVGFVVMFVLSTSHINDVNVTRFTAAESFYTNQHGGRYFAFATEKFNFL